MTQIQIELNDKDMSQKIREIASYWHKNVRYFIKETISQQGFPYWQTTKNLNGDLYDQRIHIHGGLKTYVCSCHGFVNTQGCHHIERIKQYRKIFRGIKESVRRRALSIQLP